MRITNGTPLLVGPFASRHPRTNAPAMTVALKASFRLAHGQAPTPLPEPLPFTGDVYRDDDPELECIEATDFAPWKPQADLLLKGTCHAPGGAPVGVCPVRFVVGDWMRTLLAFGPRDWQAGAGAPDVAEPFTRLPLGWTEAFGGPGFSDNPVGRGFGGEVLPRLEDEKRPLRQRGDTPAPAAFGPVNRSWPLRRRKTGSYGGDYLKTRWPGLPLDFDWSYFNAASTEQQVPYLRGDEKLILQNLDPAQPVFGTGLPGWRPRCLVRLVKGGLKPGDAEVALRELPLALDTLSVDMDAGTLALTWRGLTEVADEELEDVLEIFVMVEALDAPPAPTEKLEAFMTPAAPLLAAALATRLPRATAPGAAPTTPAATAGPASATPAAPTPPAAQTTPPAPGAPPAPAGARPGAATPPPPAPAPQEPPNPLHAAIAELKAQHAPELARIAERTQMEMARLEAKLAEDPTLAPWPGYPDAPPPPDLARQAHARLVERYQQMKESGELPSAELEEIVNKKSLFHSLDAARRAADALPPDTPAPPPPLDAAAVAARLARGESLVGANLAQADLAGMDLSRANLSQAVLRGGRLAGARLAGAALTWAQLAGADLSGADLKGADLAQADLTGACLEGADLRGAKLTRALLAGARMKRARLDQAEAELADLRGADLAGTRWPEARLGGANLCDATLDDAIFAGADLHAARLEGATGARVDFHGADLTKLQAGERLRLVASRFERATGPGSNWEAAALEGADFTGATLPGASFEKASLVGCRFDGADLAGVRLRKADLAGASFVGADLLRGTLARASLGNADFQGANLYEAEFYETVTGGARFTGANLKKTTLEGA